MGSVSFVDMYQSLRRKQALFGSKPVSVNDIIGVIGAQF